MNEEHKNNMIALDSFFKAQLKEAGELYQQLLTIATLFLGGSIVFMEKIAPNPKPPTLILIYIGWLALLISIVLLIVIRLNNIDTISLSVSKDENEKNKGKNLEKINHIITRIMVIFLTIGLIFITIFGAINLKN